MIKIFIFFISLFLFSNLNAQTIQGLIFDENDSIFPGVTVFENGFDTNIVYSDINGKYQILPHSDTATITFRFLGYYDKELRIDTITDYSIDIKLRPDITSYKEIFYLERSPNTFGLGLLGTALTPWGLIIGHQHYIMKNYPKSIYSRLYFVSDLIDQYEGFIEFCPYQIYTGNKEIRFDFMFNYFTQNKRDNYFSDYILNTDILNQYINVKVGYGLRYKSQNELSIFQFGLRKNFHGFMPNRFNIFDHVELSINSYLTKESTDYNGHVWFELLNSGFFIGIGHQKFYNLTEMNYEIRYIWRFY